VKFLITGTAGFIGFHVAKRLLEDGHEVVGFDAMTPYYSLVLKDARNKELLSYEKYRFVKGLLEDKDAIQRATDHADPDVIIHLAAQAGVRYSLEHPKAYVDSNIIGSWNVLEAAKGRDVHLMLASTSSIYGASETIPFRETDSANEPITIYAATKKAMEAMAHSYAHLHKIPTTVFRFFTVYGPWGRPDMAPYKFTKAILEGRPIEIYGEGKMSRDFTFISDLVTSIISLSSIKPQEANRVDEIDTLSRQGPFRVVNIGGGQPVPLMEFVETIERETGKVAEKIMLPMQKGDVPRTFSSPELLLALTGSKPEISISSGMKTFVEWFKQHHKQLDL